MKRPVRAMADQSQSAESGASTPNDTPSSSAIVQLGGSASETMLWASAMLSAGDEGSTSSFRLPELAASSNAEGSLRFPEDLISLWLSTARPSQAINSDFFQPTFMEADNTDSSFEDLGVHMHHNPAKLSWAGENIPAASLLPVFHTLPHSQPRLDDHSQRIFSEDVHSENAPISRTEGQVIFCGVHNQRPANHTLQMPFTAPNFLPPLSVPVASHQLHDDHNRGVPVASHQLYDDHNRGVPVASHQFHDDHNRIPSDIQAANQTTHPGAGSAPIYGHNIPPAPTYDHIQNMPSLGANTHIQNIQTSFASHRQILDSDYLNALMSLPSGYTSVYGLKPLPPNHTDTPYALVPKANLTLSMPTIGGVPGYSIPGPSFNPQQQTAQPLHASTGSWLRETTPRDLLNHAGQELLNPMGGPHVVTTLPPRPVPPPAPAGTPFRYPRIERQRRSGPIRSLPQGTPGEAPSTERPWKRTKLAVDYATALSNQPSQRFVRVSDPRPTLLYAPAPTIPPPASSHSLPATGMAVPHSRPPFAPLAKGPPTPQRATTDQCAVGPALNTNGTPRVRRGTATDPQSVYARSRRIKINERMQILQRLIPNGTKVDLVSMLDEAFNYVKYLELQIQLLKSDKLWMLATPNMYKGKVHNL